MGSIPPQSPTTSTKSRPRSRDTGFPPDFCGYRNTTLPHPEANLSPDACITSDDVSASKVLNRQRRSFLAKNRRTISHGRIIVDPEEDRLHGDLGLTSTTSAGISVGRPHLQSRSSSKDGDSLALTEGSEPIGEEDEPLTPVSPKHSAAAPVPHLLHKSSPRSEGARRGLLQRWMHK